MKMAYGRVKTCYLSPKKKMSETVLLTYDMLSGNHSLLWKDLRFGPHFINKESLKDKYLELKSPPPLALRN